MSKLLKPFKTYLCVKFNYIGNIMRILNNEIGFGDAFDYHFPKQIIHYSQTELSERFVKMIIRSRLNIFKNINNKLLLMDGYRYESI